ncbi:MAG: aminotransferase class I/II-fold pyridoxal phosphate-dependent enzyme [Candidatus Magasanikbacteria bacterium]|uniref:Aminotransferase DegT n=1 Tax=Candidatus Magasanikbacteria bacterium CG10_big_fil_rev_8_21_14_0_10_38_6 TaxID=1974647 RepID=A0A2M6P1Q3_9BACT|nr:aminotransferase class I/II-fold pyridoxal phosphate-dependent enzyme [Candidatus Magasanikbacteria bacterium]NCS72217.1 aminotransferase class I/II-fold pyridoxal phosphate-dependent enzyme [Candidatus Magasanikbacteria bacterium]PIR77655.1 MAG: hypothetical protein COU30_01230 [Candidatus Magasanikbacteria bacterium CG10_big_fil_rev_8_21_14_0_10_38_6]
MPAKQRKPIFTGFMPNMTAQDRRIACANLLFPWKWTSWQKGKQTTKVEQWLQHHLNTPHALTIDSGRSALLYSLKSLGIQKGDHVLVQAYTCLVVVNAIKWSGATPIYIDVNEKTYNMDPKDIEQKITPQTKAIIIQHTFGNPANLDAILPIAKKHKLKTIEDCAHSINVVYNGKQTGTYADAAIYSFGGEKVVSCVRGGAMITPHEKIYKTMKTYRDALPQTKRHHIARHLCKYPVFAIAKKTYNIKIGKILLAISKKITLTSTIISANEKKGEYDTNYPTQMPNVLAHILLNQLSYIDHIQKKRNQKAAYYTQHLATKTITHPQIETNTKFLRYTIQSKHAQTIIQKAKQQHIILGIWYKSVIDPTPQDQSITAYTPGSCPIAEKLAKSSINLPIHHTITKKDQNRVIALFNDK